MMDGINGEPLLMRYDRWSSVGYYNGRFDELMCRFRERNLFSFSHRNGDKINK